MKPGIILIHLAEAAQENAQAFSWGKGLCIALGALVGPTICTERIEVRIICEVTSENDCHLPFL